MSARRPHLYLLLLLAITTAAVPALAAHPEAAADFALINQDGATVRLSQFRGRLVLLSFLYTHCVDVCPLTTAKLATVQKGLQARGWAGGQVVLLSMTFDPKRDTPAALKKYAANFKVDHRSWHFLTGPPAAVMSTVGAYRVPFRPAAKPGLIDHALPILVIDRQGHVLGHYEPDFDPQAVLRHLSGLLDR